MQRWLVYFSLLLLAACTDDNARLRGEFVAGCVQGGSPKAACECLFRKIAERYSPQEFFALNQTRTPPESFKQIIGQSVLACRKE